MMKFNSVAEMLDYMMSQMLGPQIQEPAHPKRQFGGPLPMFTGPKTARKAAQRVDWNRRDKELVATAYSTNPTLENLKALIDATVRTTP